MIEVLAVGRMREGPEAMLFARYAERMRPRLRLREIAEAEGQPAEAKRREAQMLLAALPDRAYAVALDMAGASPGSEGFARLLERWVGLSRPVCFLIGGAEGLDATVIARADQVLSLGPMTWPHLFARAMLAEQLYRAQSMAAGHPYHRVGRP